MRMFASLEVCMLFVSLGYPRVFSRLFGYAHLFTGENRYARMFASLGYVRVVLNLLG